VEGGGVVVVALVNEVFAGPAQGGTTSGDAGHSWCTNPRHGWSWCMLLNSFWAGHSCNPVNCCQWGVWARGAYKPAILALTVTCVVWLGSGGIPVM
jgi:hypothetical protein